MPPPNVPVLADFPQYMGEAFERAFGREGVSLRPTAGDWVTLLQKLEGELQDCTANRAHQHLPGKRCPFCYMEQANPGFLAFVSGQQSAVPLQIDIRSLIAQLNSFEDFRSEQGLGARDTWDLQIQEKLFSTTAARRRTAQAESDPSFIGGWAADSEQCRQATRGRPPMTISVRRAEAFGAACEFASSQRENSNVWRVQAACSHNGERWNANIRLLVIGDQLTWSSERGTAVYVRCQAPSGGVPIGPWPTR
jgi:hypothetical protein